MPSCSCDAPPASDQSVPGRPSRTRDPQATWAMQISNLAWQNTHHKSTQLKPQKRDFAVFGKPKPGFVLWSLGQQQGPIAFEFNVKVVRAPAPATIDRKKNSRLARIDRKKNSTFGQNSACKICNLAPLVWGTMLCSSAGPTAPKTSNARPEQVQGQQGRET